GAFWRSLAHVWLQSAFTSLASGTAIRMRFLTNCNRPLRQNAKGRQTMRSYAIYRTMIFVGLLSSVVGCQSNSATSCAGFRQNDLSPAGLVALTKVDRAGAERVEGNDENGK